MLPACTQAEVQGLLTIHFRGAALALEMAEGELNR